MHAWKKPGGLLCAAKMRLAPAGVHRDRNLLSDLILSHSIYDYERHSDVAGPVFFDRGIVDCVNWPEPVLSDHYKSDLAPESRSMF